ncbi:Immunity protein Imm1 [Streptoalloteichus tenebrarius]|uniref:Immunity protein Imm1 n=1 Tax=Streptoalloteichus tenebrarius (strain ATCC 17920 / DSM 40477 / JCM 4838 / CBS 697.72 / NBRC 16177 / NCIMB 11028 / NRRL B-12390 / A12253. 1 / ISP 5477) TaxID=1933 RepID=A0ABT1HT98_STRSD|nr:Imm1 family immunity protein [Streptoalloteichus tenebrarius]MCP2258744.1 Immunity protein Imm1 [Streptoalloteichus tenebrarius]BFF02898.1 hypothetical protein GCM10020241_45730 [Streptoalloteichus tenebrarius]
MTYTLEFGLQAEADDATITARTAEEVDAALDRVVAAAGTYDHNPTVHVVERPTFGPAEIPDHGLKIDIAHGAEVAALAYFGPGGGGPSMTLSTPPLANSRSLYRDIDSATPFPANAAITLDQLRAAVHEFHESGGLRPTCVDWQPADGW